MTLVDVEEVKFFIGERIEILREAADSFEELGYLPSVDRVMAVVKELDLLLRYINGDKTAYQPKDDEPLEPLPPLTDKR